MIHRIVMCIPVPYRVLSLALLGGGVAGAQSPIGIFEGKTDVGRVSHAGSATYDLSRQEYQVAGSGRNMWNDRDDFHFVWKRMSGNFILSTRARFIGKGVEPHRKIGWTIRPSLEPNAAHVTAAVHGDGLASLQFRRTLVARPRRSSLATACLTPTRSSSSSAATACISCRSLASATRS